MISEQKPLNGRRGPYSGLSKAEQIKAASDRLRGSVAEELENGAEAFRSDTLDILKHHGTYQHDDRDLRGPRSAGREQASPGATDDGAVEKSPADG